MDEEKHEPTPTLAEARQRRMDIQMQHLRDRLAGRKLSLTLTDDAHTYLAEKGYDAAFGGSTQGSGSRSFGRATSPRA